MIFERLKQSLRPEFLNRIDELVVFEPLTASHIRKIVKIQLSLLQNKLFKQNITLEYTPQAVQALTDLGYDPLFGARPLKRVIQKKVLNALSKQLLEGTVNKEESIILDAFDQQLVFRSPNGHDGEFSGLVSAG